MGLLSSKKEGGMMDVIRCDEKDYLIWKWRPSGEANTTKKENAIRWGSSLRVKDGELAVFVYNQKEGPNQDFLEGPHDEIIKTANFPVITSIVGLAYAGKSPFQAEVYFINLAGNVQMKFGIPFFDVFDPRFLDFAVPVSARGSITFNITDYKGFIKLNRMIDFQIEDFKKQINQALLKYVKGVITNIPEANGIPVIQLERKILEVNDLVETKVKEVLETDFGVNVKRFDLGSIEIDKTSVGYAELRKITSEQQTKTIEAQANINIKNLEDTQRINSENMEESLRIQREEAQRAQKLQTENQNLTAHQMNLQAGVGQTAAESMGKMGQGGSAGGGMDPGSMMASMAMGGAVGGGMAGMMGNMMNGLNQPQQTPPPPPSFQYMVMLDGQQGGPFSMEQMQQLVQAGKLSSETHVWKQGMPEWVSAGTVHELTSIFGAPASVPPPPPPPPPPS